MIPTHFNMGSVETEDSTYISLQTSYWLTIYVSMDPEVEIFILYFLFPLGKSKQQLLISRTNYKKSKH